VSCVCLGVELGLPNNGSNTVYGCLTEGFCGEELDLREIRSREDVLLTVHLALISVK
jgi:hypothetical protein